MVLAGYLWRLLTAPFRGSPLGLAFRMMLASTVGLVVWALHTWMVVVLNEGTHASDPMLRQVLALTNVWTFFTGTALWSLGTWFCASLVGRMLFVGPLKTVGALLGLPLWVFQTARRSASTSILAVSLGMSVGAISGTLGASRPLALSLALGGYLSLSLRENAVPLGILRAASTDVRRLFGLSGSMDVGAAALALVGAGVGFLHAAVLPGLMSYCDGVAVLFLGVGAFLALRVRGGLALLLLLAVVPSLLVALPALADDGGWREAGRTLPGWINSPGAIPAILVGLGPALGSAIGTLIGLVGAIPLELGEDTDGDGVPDGFVDGPEGDLGWVWDTPPDPDAFVWVGGPDDMIGPDWDQGGASCGGGSFGLPGYAVNLAQRSLYVRDPMYRQGLGPGPAVELVLSWSLGLHDHDFGPGWRFSYDEAVVAHGDGFALWLGTGGVVLLAEGVHEGWRLDHTEDRIEISDPRTRLVRGYSRLGAVWVLTDLTDPFGQRVVVERTAGQIRAVIDAVGRRYEVERDEAGRITQIALPDGRSCRFAYEGARLVHTWDLAGVEVRYGWEGDQLVSMAVGERPRTWAFGWDGDHLASVTDPDGATTTYATRLGGLVRRTDPAGQVWESLHHEGRMVRAVDPLGRETRQEWENGRRTALHLPGDRTWRFTYDEAGAPTAITDPCGHTRQLVWSEEGRLVEEVGADGRSWKTEWEGGRPVRTVDPAGAVTELAWDERGQIREVRYPSGGRLRTERDAHGNPVRMVDELDRVHQLEYDAHGLRLVGRVDPLGQRTVLERDGNDRITRELRADGTSVHTEWGCCAAVATVLPDGSRLPYERDGALRLTRWGQGSQERRATYDPEGRMTALHDPEGRALKTEYDAVGRPVALTGPARTERLNWGPDDTVTAFTDAAGRTLWQVRDGRRRLVEEVDPLGRKQSWTWDPEGRLLAATDPRGRTLRFDYDAAGRVQSREAEGEPEVRWTYDEAGRVRVAQSAAGERRLDWDLGGRVTAVHYPDLTEARLGYDARSHLVRVSCPGLELSLVRDARGRVVELRVGDHRVAYTRDARGRVVEQRRSNGVSTAARWSADGALVGIRHQRGDDPAFIALERKRDSLGRVVGRTGEVPLAPPLPEPREGQVDDADQLIRWGEVAYAYDEAGNRVSGSDGWSAAYDAEGRLVAVGATRFVYDGEGNRARIEGPSGTRVQHRDPWGRLLFETDGEGALLAAWAWDDDGPVARVGPDGKVAFYHGDCNGNVLALTDEQGAVQVAFGHDAWGNTRCSDPAWADPFGWAGGWGVEHDGDGLYLMRRRHYHASTGRFLQRDPAGPLEGLNRYHYVGNSPLSGSDPSGRFLPPLVIVGLTLGVAGAVAAAVRVARRTMNGPIYGTIRRVGENARVKAPSGAVREAVDRHLGPGSIRDKVLRDVAETPHMVFDQVLEKTPFGTGYQLGKVGNAVRNGDAEAALSESLKLVPRIDETPFGWGIAMDGIDKNTPEFGFCKRPVTED